MVQAAAMQAQQQWQAAQHGAQAHGHAAAQQSVPHAPGAQPAWPGQTMLHMQQTYHDDMQPRY